MGQRDAEVVFDQAGRLFTVVLQTGSFPWWTGKRADHIDLMPNPIYLDFTDHDQVNTPADFGIFAQPNDMADTADNGILLLSYCYYCKNTTAD